MSNPDVDRTFAAQVACWLVESALREHKVRVEVGIVNVVEWTKREVRNDSLGFTLNQDSRPGELGIPFGMREMKAFAAAFALDDDDWDFYPNAMLGPAPNWRTAVDLNRATHFFRENVVRSMNHNARRTMLIVVRGHWLPGLTTIPMMKGPQYYDGEVKP